MAGPQTWDNRGHLALMKGEVGVGPVCPPPPPPPPGLPLKIMIIT